MTEPEAELTAVHTAITELAAIVAGARASLSGRSGNQLDYARRLRDEGETIAQIVAKTGITRTTLYRHLAPRPPESLTAGAEVETGEQGD